MFSVAVAFLRGQDDESLINVGTLEQLNAIRYDLDGDGEVSLTTDASPTGNIEDLAELSRYATLFPGGTYYTRDGGTDTELTDAAVAAEATTTYVYKLSGSYMGYELMADLDFAGTQWENPTGGTFSGTRVSGGWAPIGGTYNTTFDGNGHTISNLYINRTSTTNVGFFGQLGGSARVRNLGLEGGSVKGHITGFLAAKNDGRISACYATGNAEGTTLGITGGLVVIILVR